MTLGLGNPIFIKLSFKELESFVICIFKISIEEHEMKIQYRKISPYRKR